MDKGILAHIITAQKLIGTILDDEVYDEDQFGVLAEAWAELNEVLGLV